MKLFLKVFATLLFVLAIVPQVLAQSTRDIERAENERDLDLRSWNLRILQLQHERESKGRPRVSPAQALDQLQKDFSRLDRKSTRLNSSHITISYAVFCLKKKMLRSHFLPAVEPITPHSAS